VIEATPDSRQFECGGQQLDQDCLKPFKVARLNALVSALVVKE
jgi:hypothetical protein